MKNVDQSNQGNFQLPAGRLIGLAGALVGGMAMAYVLTGRPQPSGFSPSTTDLRNEKATSGLGAVQSSSEDEAVFLDNLSAMPGKSLKESAAGKELEALRAHKLLEAEIARSLMAIQNIRAARVLLALAEPRGNAAEENESSASVTVTVDRPEALRPYQIKAMVQLVAASVPRLKAERVIVVDQRGQLLNSKENLWHSNWNAEQFEYKKNLEQQLTEQAVHLLSSLVGAEAVRVAVTADLNFPGSGPSPDAVDAEVPGAASRPSAAEVNSPLAEAGNLSAQSGLAVTGADAAAGKNNPVNGRAEKRVKYEHLLKPVLRKLSVSVLLDDNRSVSADQKIKSRAYSPKDLDGFSRLVKQAVGFDSGRGDQLTLAHASFKKKEPEPSFKDLPYWQRNGFYPRASQIITGVVALLLLLGIIRSFRRRRTKRGRVGLSAAHHAKARESAWAGHGGYERSGIDPGQWGEFQQALQALPNDIAAILQFDPPADYLLRLEYIKKIIDADARWVAEMLILYLKKTGFDAAQLEKAALVMLSLGRDRAAAVIRFLPPREMQKIGAAMAGAKEVSSGAMETAVEELIAEIKSRNGPVLDKEDYIRQVFTIAIGEDKAKRMMERIWPGSLTRGIEQFKWMDGRSVADLISNEHPQIIAIILSVLDSEQAAEVIMSMPEHLRADLLTRIALTKGVQPSALRELDQMIELRLPDTGGRNVSLIGGIDSAAGILNRIDSRTGDVLLAEIADQNTELARNIQEKMFIFDDLIHLDAKGMQALLREISTSQLLSALTGVGEELKEKVFKCMSRRASEMLREDLITAPAAHPGEIEFARKSIVRTVKKLVDAGEIRLCINKELS